MLLPDGRRAALLVLHAGHSVRHPAAADRVRSQGRGRDSRSWGWDRVVIVFIKVLEKCYFVDILRLQKIEPNQY